MTRLTALQKILEIDVLDKKKLKTLGFDGRKYYCGPHAQQKKITIGVKLIKKTFKYKPIYNQACFLHDRAYNTHPTVEQKILIDKVFALNMSKLLYRDIRKSGFSIKSIIQIIGLGLFYVVVRKMTNVYIKQGIIKK